MNGHRRQADAKSLLIATTVATLVYGAAIAGSTRAAASVDAAAVTRSLAATATAPRSDVAAAHQAKKTRKLELAPLSQAEAAVLAQVNAGAFPGAALAVGREDQPVLERGIGRIGWSSSAARVDPDRTVYDLASLTKVVATTPAVMLLVEDGKMDLDAPVIRYLPEFGGGARDRVTIRQLLTHSSGLPAGVELDAGTPEGNWKQLLRTPLVHAPGEAVVYSDVGMNVLFAAAQRAAGEPLYGLLDRRVYGPLKMRRTTYLPGEGCQTCAPTLRDENDAPVQGLVHDPIARRLGGVAGNAGLFSTAHDLGRFAAMMANGGELDGVRIFREETVRMFAGRQVETRALGWDTPGPNGSGGFGARASKDSFGHTGFTGTSIWIDPERHTWTVLLSNRVYQPRAPNTIMALRRKVNDRVAIAADDFDIHVPAAD
ncbi:serine hydrolase domain-containing protein [Longimicrobium sp.]|uniref:serine hydrolase domain-containing protein n=1 Tax=Longimicrobium sp. TaxID=2029185 RepID=UPI002BCB8AD8|nr:serine hydrolase domain-containing protein [Longimicrobium sp.]HSU16049.1 serine hydrolase domain-containing protein [Longimicrobium sp.]